MNLQLIQLANPILVSDEKIKDNDFMYRFKDGVVKAVPDFFWDFKEPYKKVIAGIPELPRLDLSLVAGKIGYVDVEFLSKEYSAEVYPINGNTRDEVEWIESQKILLEQGFMAGFNANPKKYTEEDIRNAIKYGIDSSIGYTHSTDYMTKEELRKVAQIEEEFIFSLQQPKVYNVEVEMMYKNGRGHGLIKTNIPKITNNTIKVTKILP